MVEGLRGCERPGSQSLPPSDDLGYANQPLQRPSSAFFLSGCAFSGVYCVHVVTLSHLVLISSLCAAVSSPC